MKRKIITVWLILLSVNLSSAFVQAIQDFEGDYTAVPKKLSETGLYSDFSNQIVKSSCVLYELNSILWTDGAAKKRWICLPDGQSITPTDTAYWDYPAGTIIIKNFYLDTIVGDPTSRITVETRFLKKSATANGLGSTWRFLSYEWLVNQSEAFLSDMVPEGQNHRFIRVKEGGEVKTVRWIYPEEMQCLDCHNEEAGGALGLNAPNLNRESALGTNKNQLEDFFDRGIINKNIYSTALFKYASLSDPLATNEVKIRSWLFTNCSFCHSDVKQQEGAYHEFRYYRGSETPTWVNQESQTGDSEFPKLVVPGHPDSSWFLAKMAARASFINASEYGQMPPLGTYVPNDTVIKIFSDYICSLDPSKNGNCNEFIYEKATAPEEEEFDDDEEYWMELLKTQTRDPSLATQPTKEIQHGLSGYISEHRLFVTGESVDLSQVVLHDINGKVIPMKHLGKGVFFVPIKLTHGVYLLRLENKTVKLIYNP